MSDLEKYELIDKYLEGELKGQELQDFNARLISDNAFAEEVEAQRAANEIIFDNRLVELKHKLQKDFFHKQKTSGNLRRGLIIGASLIILLTGSYLFFTTKKTEKQSPINSSIQSHKPSSELNEKKSEGMQDENSSLENNNNSAIEENNNLKNKEDKLSGNKKLSPSSASETRGLKTGSGKGKSSAGQSKETQIQRIQKIDVTGNCYLTFNRAFIVNPACPGKEDGSIQINASAISGGNGDYIIYANKKKLKSPYILSNIPSGKYLIQIKMNHENCIDSINISVPSRNCP